jgi:hypothetical protein
MTRSNLEHIIRAAGAIADDPDIIIIGSQSILGQFPDADPALLVSMEADVYPKNHADRSDLIDGSIGESSPFEREFGYYAHGVDATTAVLPQGWEQRLVLVTGENTRHVRGWCLEAHDLAIAKLVAGRPKDLDFVQTLARRGYVEGAALYERLAVTNVSPALRPHVEARIANSVGSAGSSDSGTVSRG